MSAPAIRSSRTAPQPRDSPTPSSPLELVDPEAWRRRRRARMIGFVAALVFVASPFVIVVMNVQMAQRQIQLQHLRTARDAEQRQYQSLRDQVLQESSPDGIVPAARKLGLEQAASVTVVTVPVSETPPADIDGDATLAIADNAVKDKLAKAP